MTLGEGRANTLKRHGMLYPEPWFVCAVFAMVLALFLGNKFLGLAHGLAGIGLLVGIGRHRLGRPCWNRLRPSTWGLIAFVVACSLSVIANWDNVNDPFGVLKRLRYPVIVILLLLLSGARNVIFATKDQRGICFIGWWTVLVCSILVGGARFFFPDAFAWLGDFGYPGRLSGFYGQVMTFSYILQFSVVSVAALVIYPEIYGRLTKIPYWVLFPVILIAGWGQYFSYSRGAILSVAIGIGLLSLLHSRRMVVAAVALAIAAGSYAYSDSYGKNGTPLYFTARDPVRVSQWKTASLTFLEHPIFGVGYRTFEQRCLELQVCYGIGPSKPVIENGVERRVYFSGHAHNNILEAFASSGVLGGIGFLAFVFLWARECWSVPEVRRFFMPLIAVFLVSGFFENTFFDSEVLSCILLIYLCSQIALDRAGRLPAFTRPSA